MQNGQSLTSLRGGQILEKLDFCRGPLLSPITKKFEVAFACARAGMGKSNLEFLVIGDNKETPCFWFGPGNSDPLPVGSCCPSWLKLCSVELASVGERTGSATTLVASF